MKINRNVIGGALAAFAVVALMSGLALMDHAYAVAGLSGVSAAMAGLVTIKAPVTVFHKGQFVAPGTSIEVDEVEARRLTAAHGAFGGPGDPDPGNTQMRNVDIASINALNEQSSIHKGTGSAKPTVSEPVKLKGMSKPELIEQAQKEGVAIDGDDTAPQIAEKIEAARKVKEA